MSLSPRHDDDDKSIEDVAADHGAGRARLRISPTAKSVPGDDRASANKGLAIRAAFMPSRVAISPTANTRCTTTAPAQPAQDAASVMAVAAYWAAGTHANTRVATSPSVTHPSATIASSSAT